MNRFPMKPNHQLSYEEQRAFRRAVRVGYLRTCKTNNGLISCWRAQCEHKKRPFVHLSLDTKSTKLEIDLSPIEARLTLPTITILKLLCLLNNRMWRVCTPSAFLVNQLPIEQAESFARIILTLLRHMPKATEPNEEPIA